ncbi:MAG: hypothetical protein Ct9H90mP21_3170 [Methanobacteriota archaeon]|nr:MAG: hypothetical protein Ct9H90mP21_3170 [Euryarchaeota archaeon]
MDGARSKSVTRATKMRVSTNQTGGFLQQVQSIKIVV